MAVIYHAVYLSIYLILTAIRVHNRYLNQFYQGIKDFFAVK